MRHQLSRHPYGVLFLCAAMLYPYHVARDKDEPFQTVDTMQTVEADNPMDAVAKLASAGLLPSDGTFYVRIVTAVHENGMPSKAICVPRSRRRSRLIGPSIPDCSHVPVFSDDRPY